MENIFGKILKIDLTTRTTETIRLEEDLYLKYLGGRGLGSYLLHHWLKEGTGPLDPGNWILFLVGPVTGTPVPTASKYVVITKSPLTGGWLDSYSSGRIALEIKKARWDGLAVTGRASEPIYIDEDGRIELRVPRNCGARDPSKPKVTCSRRLKMRAPWSSDLPPKRESNLRE